MRISKVKARNAKSEDVNYNVVRSEESGILRSILYELKHNRILYLMLLLPVIWLIIFRYVPMYGIIIAFQDFDPYSGMFNSKWIGIKYFKQILTDPYFYKLFKNNIILGFESLIIGFPIPIFLAICIFELKNKTYKKVTQTISYLPHFISTVMVVGIVFELFSQDGMCNNLIAAMGFGKINFIGSDKYFRSLYIGSGIWQSAGWSSIIYLAALSGVDVQLYESAAIDGANRFQRIWFISIPSILTTIQVLFILNIGSVIGQNFEKVLLMQNPGNIAVSEMIETYTYRRGIIGANFSYGTAIGLFMNIIAFILLIFTNKISHKINDNSLF